MKKSFVNQFNRKTAEYIVAHAKWQRSQGRNPSESYKGKTNPKEALTLALEELGHYEPMAGENVSYTAVRLVKITSLTGQPCTAYFNDIKLVANPGDKSDNIVDFFSQECERQSQEYRESPAGKRVAQEAEERRLAAQAKLDQLMDQLPTLDFGDLTAIVKWFDELQDPSDHIGVNRPWQQIVETFVQHGFAPGMNCGENFDEEDEANFAGYLIGQALSGLACEVHAIHQIYCKFAEDWRTKFGKAA